MEPSPKEPTAAVDASATAVSPPSLDERQIAELVDRYRREMARYEKAATIVGERLRRELRQAGIRHMVSHRPKHPDDLHGKLALKASKPTKHATYSWAALQKDIGAVVTDLAGCRVVVYSNEDEETVAALVPTWFEQPTRADAAVDRRRGIDNPYWATHALVHPYRTGEAPDPVVDGAICELQIVTVPAHLFNEIQHDITFKERVPDLPADDEERQLLDELRGVARVADRIVSELLMRRQQRAGDVKTVISDPEHLRFTLSALAKRPLRGGEVARLLRILEQNLPQVTPDAIARLGDVDEVIADGRARLASYAPDDQVVLYTIGLFRHFRQQIVMASKRWRGPRTTLRDMIDLAAETPEAQALERRP